MLKALSKYGAITVKARAMYGKRLKASDRQAILGMTSTREIAEYLKRTEAWGSGLRGTASTAGTREIESALRSQVNIDYEKLFKFASLEDKKYLLFILYRTEYEFILSALRRLHSMSYSPPYDQLPEFFVNKSKVDIDALKMCTNYAQLVSAAEGSIYEQTLRDLPRNELTHLPYYNAASDALERRYYSAVYAFLCSKYNGLDKARLAGTVGLEADLLNIVHLLCMRYFPKTLQNARELLIPVRCKLRDELIEAIISAPTDEAAIGVVERSPWGRVLNGEPLRSPEALYEKYMSAFCEKLIRSGQPSICVPQSFLTLKELECKFLIRVFEAVRLGVDPQRAL